MSDLKMEEMVRLAAANFLDAFARLDWEPFCAAFAPDATLFMPYAHIPKRLNGKGSIQDAFRPLFTNLKERGEGPPYLNLDPEALSVRMMGKAALITFHLTSADHFSRRTVIFEEIEEKWLITHLHASNFYNETAKPAG